MDNQLVHFLLVEDNPDHAYLLKRNFKHYRLSNIFDHVMDGEAALKYLRQEGEYSESPRPDVVLLDLNLPKVNGHEVLEAVKSDPNLKDIPIVILTTSKAGPDMKRAMEAGADSYLTKPVDFETFCSIVKDLKLHWGIWKKPPGTASEQEAA